MKMQGRIYRHCRYCRHFEKSCASLIHRAMWNQISRFEGGVEVFLLHEPGVVKFPFALWVDKIDLLG